MQDISTLFIVDDDPAIGRLVETWAKSWSIPVECYASAEAFLASKAFDRPGCLLLDINMDGMGGLDLQAQLTKLNTSVPVIVITADDQVPTAVRAMKQQAIEFLQKPLVRDTLKSAVDKALLLDIQRRAKHQDQSQVMAKLARLTPRETEVMQLVVQGLANKQMARKLGLSEKTIEIHRSRVMHKMEADSVASLVRMSVLIEIPVK